MLYMCILFYLPCFSPITLQQVVKVIFAYQLYVEVRIFAFLAYYLGQNFT